MARTRFTFLAVLAWIVSTAASSHLRGDDLTRISLPESNTDRITFWADESFLWTDGPDDARLMSGNVQITLGSFELKAGRAVVWIDSEALKARKRAKVVIFADEMQGKKVRIDQVGQPLRELSGVVVELTTSGIGFDRGKIQRESLASTPLYAKAMAARGKPLVQPAVAKTLPPTTPSVIPKTPSTLILPPDVPAKADSLLVPTQFVQAPPKKSNPPSPYPMVLPPDLPTTPKRGQAVIGSTVIPVPFGETKTIWLQPRTTKDFDIRSELIGTERVTVIPNGVKLLVKSTVGEIRTLDAEADQVVVWSKEGDSRKGVDSMLSPEGASGGQYEFYFSGNVIIRFIGEQEVLGIDGLPADNRTLRAERVYYDLKNEKAIALHGDLEFTRQGYLNAAHVVGEEIQQFSATEWRALAATVHASRLPSDPGFLLRSRSVDIYQQPIEAQRTIFGTPVRDRRTGEVVESTPQIFEARETTTEILGVPTSYWPLIRGDINDPFGPFKGLGFRQDRIFGTQFFSTWDVFELIGVTKLKNENWDLLADYLSQRGPALGTNYTLSGNKFFDMDAPFSTMLKAYAIYDQGTDRLAGIREQDYQPTKMRGRFLFRHQQEFGDLTVQAQLAYLSDRNFHEQYYKFDYDLGPNQETFLWLKYATGNAAATALIQPDLGRNWVSETQWLPKVDGYWLGQSFLDTFTYHTWGSVAYARLDPYRNPTREFPFQLDVGVPRPEEGANTGRIDWMQQLAMPIDAGPLKVVPYGVLDLAYYTANVNGEGQGRIWGGGGVKTSLPLSRLYNDVESDLFNLKGLYHKSRFNTNYLYTLSSVGYEMLPQLDRLNDDATEAAWRNITPWHPFFPETRGEKGNILSANKIYDQRYYAIRRLVDTKPDTLDSIHVLQAEWQNRWQTKRGFPGMEHTVDWLTFDVSASFYPTQNRDNLGKPLAFLEYRGTWNIGDQNGIYSSGWTDVYDARARYWQIGTYFYRDDRTQFNLNYMQIEPVNSKILTGQATYVFSPKYAVTATTVFDFGSDASLTNALLFTRIGTDLQISVGFSYNALVNNFGFVFNVVPNLFANRMGPAGALAGGLAGNNFQDRR